MSMRDIECLHIRDNEVITASWCRSLSSNINKNLKCQQIECESPWRACSLCIESGKKSGKIDSVKLGVCIECLDGVSVRKEGAGGRPPISDADLDALMDQVDSTSEDDTDFEYDSEIKRIETAKPLKKVNGSNDKVDVSVSKLNEATEDIAITDKENNVSDSSKKISKLKDDKEQVFNKLVADVVEKTGEPVKLNVKDIRRFEKQPRIYFGEEDLVALGESLKGFQLIPIFVRKLSKEEFKKCGGKYKYELIDGERRWTASKRVGKLTLHALVLDVSDERIQFAISAIANFGRKGHEPIEDAMAIKTFIDDWGLSKTAIARKFSKSEPWVYDRLRLLNLCAEARSLLNPELPRERQMSMMVAKELSFHEDHLFQKRMIKKVVNEKTTSRKAVQVIRKEAEEAGLKVIKKSTGIDSAPRFYQAIVRLSDTLWSRLPYIEQSERFFVHISSAADKEERDTLKNNLTRIAYRIIAIAKKL